jgi:hypothetical protein
MAEVEYKWEVIATAKYAAIEQSDITTFMHEPIEEDLIELSKRLSKVYGNRTFEYSIRKVVRISLHKDEV